MRNDGMTITYGTGFNMPRTAEEAKRFAAARNAEARENARQKERDHEARLAEIEATSQLIQSLVPHRSARPAKNSKTTGRSAATDGWARAYANLPNGVREIR